MTNNHTTSHTISTLEYGSNISGGEHNLPEGTNDHPMQGSPGEAIKVQSLAGNGLSGGSGHGSLTAYSKICDNQRNINPTRHAIPNISAQPPLPPGQNSTPNSYQGNQAPPTPHSDIFAYVTILLPSEEAHRFLHLNTGGISYNAKFVEFKLLVQNIMRFNADIFGINEHTLKTSQTLIKKQLQDINQQCNKYGQIVLASSAEQYPRAYKTGGTMVGFTGQIANCKVDKGTDKQGR